MLARLYRYGSEYRVVWFRSGNANCFGLDGLDGLFSGEEKPKKKAVETVENGVENPEKCPADVSEKLANNISRARGRVQEIALCNEWEWFATFTLDDAKQDRFCLRQYVHDLGVWIGNYNRKYGTRLQYIIIPEQHKDGAWHAHGLLHGVSADSLAVNEYGYMDMPYYRNRFGYISLSKIKDTHAVARYVTKYISKDIAARKGATDEHLFYSSHGLRGREQLLQVVSAPEPADGNGIYKNDYIISAYYNSEAEALAALCLPDGFTF